MTENVVDLHDLRKNHNSVKEEILQKFNPKTILDIGSGLGGDLWKWARLDSAKVLGVDCSRKAKQEAMKRLRAVRKTNKFLNVWFEVVDVSEDSAISDIIDVCNRVRWLPEFGKFDMVSCQFAFNYFLESEAILDNVMTIISSALKPGGIFVALAMDGRKITGDIDEPGIQIRSLSDNSYTVNFLDSSSGGWWKEQESEITEFMLIPDQFKQFLETNFMKYKLYLEDDFTSLSSMYDTKEVENAHISDYYFFFSLKKF